MLALALPFAAPAGAQSITPADWRADVATFARRIVERGLAPGIGVAVARGDRVEFTAGFGLANLDERRPVDDRTSFYIASTTKSLTALAVVLAADRGHLDLTAPVSRYLPSLRLRPPLSADSITLEGLLTMTHGIDDGGPVVFRTAYSGEFTSAQLLALLGDYSPASTGNAFAYGNLGYNILGLVLEARFGLGWKEVIERDVLTPAGMSATTAYVSRVDPAHLARPHAWTPDGFSGSRLGKTDANMHAAGGHFATAADLARYVAAHQSGGVLEGRRIFAAPPVGSTHRIHAVQDREFGPYHRYGWGYGWDLGTYGADTLIHRFGSFPGYRSHVSFMPYLQLGVVVLVNGGGPASSAADLLATYIYDRARGRRRLDSTYAARLEALVTSASRSRARLAQDLADRRGRQEPLPHPLQHYVGEYESDRLGRMSVRVLDSGLVVTMGAAFSRTEVADAGKDRLRVELTGPGGETIEFLFPAHDQPARAVRYRGEVLTRRQTP